MSDAAAIMKIMIIIAGINNADNVMFNGINKIALVYVPFTDQICSQTTKAVALHTWHIIIINVNI